MSRPKRICFVGPALGRNDGWVTTQGEVLSDLFLHDGHPVRLTSSQIGRARRAADTEACLVRWRRDIDVAVISVFSGGAFALADLASRTTRSLGLPTVLWLHGGDLPGLFIKRSGWARRVLRRGDAVVAPSAYLARPAASLGARPVIIPNVLDLDAIQFRLRTHLAPRLLWMRTFHDLYNPELAIEALVALRREFPTATLTMAGQEKGSFEQTRSAARAAGLSAAVSFPGFINSTEKSALFEAHDVYLNTNRVDNAPVSVLEAAASGLPIVATQVGGLGDLLDDGGSALLVGDNDAQAMADAVARLLDDEALATRLSQAGRRVAERSAWPSVRDQWLSLFDRVLDERYAPGVKGGPALLRDASAKGGHAPASGTTLRYGLRDDERAVE